MKGFKGFDKGLVCRGKKYKENTVFEEEAAEICKNGMHFCENPFDVLDYYDLVNTDGSFNEFAEVEALDKCLTDDNKKYCTKKLKIGAKLSFSGFVNACIEFIFEKTKIEKRMKKISHILAVPDIPHILAVPEIPHILAVPEITQRSRQKEKILSYVAQVTIQL